MAIALALALALALEEALVEALAEVLAKALETFHAGSSDSAGDFDNILLAGEPYFLRGISLPSGRIRKPRAGPARWKVPCVFDDSYGVEGCYL